MSGNLHVICMKNVIFPTYSLFFLQGIFSSPEPKAHG